MTIDALKSPRKQTKELSNRSVNHCLGIEFTPLAFNFLLFYFFILLV